MDGRVKSMMYRVYAVILPVTNIGIKTHPMTSTTTNAKNLHTIKIKINRSISNKYLYLKAMQQKTKVTTSHYTRGEFKYV